MIKNLPFPFCSLLHVKNCVLYIDNSVEFAFDSCAEISKFLNKSGNTTENYGNTLSKLRESFTAIHRSSVMFHGGICRFKTFLHENLCT